MLVRGNVILPFTQVRLMGNTSCRNGGITWKKCSTLHDIRFSTGR
jgi:hypothetical protein